MLKLLLLLTLLACAYAQLTNSQISALTTSHVNARKNASPTPNPTLTGPAWNTTLAAYAQSWVSQCKRLPSPKAMATLYGENLFFSSGTLDVTAAFNNWNKQSSSFNYNTATCSAATCKAYTQIVATGATQFGCASASCPSLGGTLLSCNYATYMQYVGVQPYSTTGKRSVEAEETDEYTAMEEPDEYAATNVRATRATTTPAVDYRGSRVTAIKDQGTCGAGWAFAATAVYEGAVALAKNSLQTLSDQNTLDCAIATGSCSSGWIPDALKGLLARGGIETLANYPYTAQPSGSCKYTAAKSIGAALNLTGQTGGDFGSMYAALVKYGPVAIGVFADSSWFTYSTGVLANDAGAVNHAVTIVGYDPNLDAWIIKNSWGISWGNSGYAYLSTSTPAGANLYGAFYAAVKK